MEKKIQSKKGFTLAELLIVVAIISVLVGISVPIFASKTESSKQAVDFTNIRSAYAEVVAEALTNPDNTYSAEVTLKSDSSKWKDISEDVNIAGVPVKDMIDLGAAGSKAYVYYDKKDIYIAKTSTGTEHKTENGYQASTGSGGNNDGGH